MDIVQRFIKLGLSEALVSELCLDALLEIDKDPDEDEILMKALKNQSKEQKAQ